MKNTQLISKKNQNNIESKEIEPPRKLMVCPDIEEYYQLLKKSQNLLKEIRFHSVEKLTQHLNTYEGKDPGKKHTLGKRSLFWYLKSINTIFDFIPTEMLIDEKICNYILISSEYHPDKIEQYNKPRSKKRTDYFWSISFYQAINELNVYFGLYSKRLDIEIKKLSKEIDSSNVEEKIRDWEKEIAKYNLNLQNFSKSIQTINKKYELKNSNIENYLIKNINRSKSNDEEELQNFYINFWCLNAIKDEVKLEKLSKILLKKAKLLLRNHLSFYQSNSPKFNQITLALSASIIANYNKDKNSDDFYEIEKEIVNAQEICYNGKREFYEKRFVLQLSDFNVFNSIPFEDIYILSDINSEINFDISIITTILNYVYSRLTKNKFTGISDENSKEYPFPSPYFTSYSIILLTRINYILKAKIKNLLIKNIENINGNLISRAKKENDIIKKDKEIINGKEIIVEKMKDDAYDTQEKTLNVILEKLSEDTYKKNNSILLFGPPGTGKTFTVDVITNILNKRTVEEWEIITLAPSLFLTSDSFSMILKDIELLFNILLVVDNCVFFFDEAEELIRKREKDDFRFGRMFTAAMLLFLNRMKEGNSFFIFATNFIQNMDDAAIRKGRFDIRKGLGWIHNDYVNKFVNNEFATCNNDVKEKLKDYLKDKPIKELIEIKKELQKRNPQNSLRNLEPEMIDDYFKSHKPYLSDKVIANHKEQCEFYDDTYPN